MLDDLNFKDDQPYMIKYAKAFIQDAIDRPHEWVNLRNLHGVFMTLMERGLAKWSNRKQIKSLCQRYIYNITKGLEPGQPGSPDRDTSYVPCIPYQTDQCKIRGSHTGLTHLCAYCWKKSGKVGRHKEMDCWTKKEDGKKGLL